MSAGWRRGGTSQELLFCSCRITALRSRDTLWADGLTSQWSPSALFMQVLLGLRD